MKKLLSILFLCCAVLLYTNTVNAQCTIDIALTGVDCSDNGTPDDGTDDVYTLEVTVNYINAVGTTYTVTNAPGGPVIATGTYSTPPNGTDVLNFMIAADGSSLDLTVFDDGDNTCTFSTGDLGILAPCSAGAVPCLVSSGSSVTSPVCAGAVEGVFTVTVGTCTADPGTTQNELLLMYDLDVSNAPPTSDDLYNDLIGAVDAPDLVWFGEDSDCSGATFIDLEGFENPSCTAFEADLYLVPADLAAGLIAFECAIEGPIRLVTEPAAPTYITDCAAGELIAGFDNGDGAGGAPDGDFDDPEDFICGSTPIDISGCPATAGSAQFTAADLGGLFGNDGSCYPDSEVFTCPCACNTVAPSVTITGEDCADGTMGAPYVVGEDGTGFLDTGDIIEYIVVDDAAGTATGVPGAIISVGDLAAAQAVVDAAPEGSEVCMTAIAHSPAQLDAILTDLNVCTNGLVSTLLGITPPLETFEALFNGLITANAGMNPNLTVADVEVYIGGSGGGPGMGATVDIGVLAGLPAGVLTCDVPPFCYNVLAETCVTINGACPVACAISNLNVTANACNDNGTPTDISDDTYTVDISFDYSGAGATYTIDDGTSNGGNAYATAGTGTETITAYGSYAADGVAVVNITITDDGDAACTASASAGPVATCSMPPDPMASISDPCNCTNGIDLDGDGVNDLAMETITITDPNGAGQGWALTTNDGGLVGIDGASPTTSPVVDNGDGTYTQTGYVVADGATTYSAEFTSASGEVLAISGGPCAACPAPQEEVPTVGEWGLIILGLLMSIAAIVGIRQRRLEENIA